jgi:NAD(P)H-flavin reductase
MTGHDPWLPTPARVLRRRRETASSWTLELEPANGQPFAPFAPGQFNMLYLLGVGEVAISMSGDPALPGRVRHTIRSVGPVSDGLARLEPGMALGLRGPFGKGWPMAEAEGRDVIVVAGGLGLAPLRPAIYRLLAERERYGRIALAYGTRGPGDILYRHELEGWRRRLDIDIQVTVDHAGGEWRGQVGVVTGLLKGFAFDPEQAIALVCGPEVMMRFAVEALLRRGLPAGAIHLSMERNMKCAVAQCGRCQLGGHLVCRDGPVFRYDRIAHLLPLREV